MLIADLRKCRCARLELVFSLLGLLKLQQNFRVALAQPYTKRSSSSGKG